MIAFEDPAGDILCESCVDEVEVVQWERQAYIETDPQPGEFCIICGDPFIMGEN